MAAEAGNGNRLYLAVGDAVRVRLPYSEVCVHMQVAGKPMWVAIIEEGGQPEAQLLHDNGSYFSTPILLEEAGIQREGTRLYVPTRMLVTPQDGLTGL